jgi:hypothetical protein
MAKNESHGTFVGLLFLFILILLSDCGTFLAAMYFLAESIKNNNRWLAFGLLFLLASLIRTLLIFLNHRMSNGDVGHRMQFLRSYRFADSFVSVTLGAFLAAGIIVLEDEVIHTTPSEVPFGSWAALLCSIACFYEFFSAYYIFLGRGVSRL